MGLAATQMRFLALTAKKSNSEYQGQQINQQRLNLANQSSGIYTKLADLNVPVPPPQATRTNGDTRPGTPLEGAVFNTTTGNAYKIDGTGENASATNLYEEMPGDIGSTTYYVVKNTVLNTSGSSSIRFYLGTDANDVYTAAYKDYEASLTNYNSQMSRLEAESKNVQIKDKKLELQLKRIDTEHSAIKTELDAIEKILDDNIESSFKTFS